MTTTLIFRSIGWLLVLAIAAFTLSPIELRPVTDAPAGVERLVAFVTVGATLCLGYPKHHIRLVLLVIGAAGLLEALQHVVPGRHGQIHDFVTKAIGVAVGAVLISAAERIFGGCPASRSARQVAPASENEAPPDLR